MATGASADEAIASLLKGWREHARQTGADPTYLLRDDINVVTGPLGQCFRDHSPISSSDEQLRDALGELLLASCGCPLAILYDEGHQAGCALS
jgi:hypothetical protein